MDWLCLTSSRLLASISPPKARPNSTGRVITSNTNPFSYTNHTIAAWVYANDTNAKIILMREMLNEWYSLLELNKALIVSLWSIKAYSQVVQQLQRMGFFVGTYRRKHQTLYVDGTLATSTLQAQVLTNRQTQHWRGTDNVSSYHGRQPRQRRNMEPRTFKR